MDILAILKALHKEIVPGQIGERLAAIEEKTALNATGEVYRKCFASLDLTSLNTGDNSRHIRAFVRKVAAFNSHFEDMPPVAGVCVYPSFVEDAGVELGDADISLVSAGGGFPHGHTYPEVKVLECSMAVENGADEIDIVMNVGAFLEGDYGLVAGEIDLIRKEIEENALLKVIIESGELENPAQVREAALIAAASGADFVKTSTGKTPVSATPEAVLVICDALADYYRLTGQKKGVKISGGIDRTEKAVLYYTIVETVLGEEWLSPRLFRIGASRLADRLLSDIYKKPVGYFG